MKEEEKKVSESIEDNVSACRKKKGTRSDKANNHREGEDANMRVDGVLSVVNDPMGLKWSTRKRERKP